MIESTVSGMDGAAGTGCRPVFEIKQGHDADGALRVTLRGELDLAVTDRLRDRLSQLAHAEGRVRLDLSQLEFIDCSGVNEIVGALAEARRSRSTLEVDRIVSPIVGRITAFADIASALWPADATAAHPR